MSPETPEEEEELRRLTRFRELLATGAAHVFGIDADTGAAPERMGELAIEGVDVMHPTAALELVAPAEQPLAIAAVGRVMEEGVTTDELLMADGTWATSHLFDLRRTFGLIAGVNIASDRLDQLRSGERPQVAPRVGVLTLDRQGRPTWISDDLRRLLGWPDGVSVSPAGDDNVLGNIHPEDYQRNIAVWAAMLATPGEPHRARYRRRRYDGSWMWCETTLVCRLDDPVDPRVDGEVLDISAEMAAHEAVRTRERLLQRLAESLPDGVLQLDAERRVVYANTRAELLLGVDATPGGLIERAVPEDREKLRDAIEDALGAGLDRVVEIRVSPPAGTARAGRPGDAGVYEVTLRSVVDEEDRDSPGRQVSGAICCIADVTQQVRRRAELEARATYDELTTAHNRASTVRILAEALGDAGPGHGVAVIFVDLDGFKQVNDEHGHAVGDRLLVTAADRLRRSVRSVDVVGRLGGDEFLVVCPGLASPVAAQELVERIGRMLVLPTTIDGIDLEPRASIGLAWTFAPGSSADALVADADASMYDMKRAGGSAR